MWFAFLLYADVVVARPIVVAKGGAKDHRDLPPQKWRYSVVLVDVPAYLHACIAFAFRECVDHSITHFKGLASRPNGYSNPRAA